jgi:two-component system sensor histidine kinase TctE
LRNSAERPRLSFVARFIEWLFGPLVFLWLATAGIGLFMISRAVDENFDAQLEDAAQAVAVRLAATGNPTAPLALTPSAEALLHPDRFEARQFALRDANGHVFAGDPEMPLDTGPAKREGVTLHGGMLGDDAVRIASVPVPVAGTPNREVVLQLAESMTRRQALATSLRTASFLPQFVLLGGAFLLVWYGLAYVITPMRRLKAAIDARDPLDVTPIDPEAVPQEMKPLIVSINGLLSRVGENFEAQRRFIADAAHQLRTPLAGLKSQSELALAESDPALIRAALERIASGTERATHLANRLLALARAASVHAPAYVPVPLGPLARGIVADFVPHAVERGIDFGLEVGDSDVPTVDSADPILLRELLSNLVDNALRYTPSGGAVTVRIQRSAVGEAELEVVDTGPGIPDAERDRVFDPFFRGADAPAGGSGLGLTIVRTIAGTHGAHVSLCDGPDNRGTCVRVTFAAHVIPA